MGDRREALVGGFAGGTAWGVYTEDPAVAAMAVEYVRQDIALQIIADRVGHEGMSELCARDPELKRFLSDHGYAAALLRTTGMPGPRPRGTDPARTTAPDERLL